MKFKGESIDEVRSGKKKSKNINLVSYWLSGIVQKVWFVTHIFYFYN